MYPTDDLASLQARKRLIVARSSLLRAECVIGAGTLAQPIGKAESAIALIKRLSPLLALTPFFFARKRTTGKGLGLFRMALKYGPLMYRALHAFRSAPRTRPSSSNPNSP